MPPLTLNPGDAMAALHGGRGSIGSRTEKGEWEQSGKHLAG